MPVDECDLRPQPPKRLGQFAADGPGPDDGPGEPQRLAGNVEPLAASFNEYPLHLGNRKTFGIGEYEVTPLLRRGNNIFAVKVAERPGISEANCGLAFHLELLRHKDQAQAPDIDPTAALLTTTEGDRVWGFISDLSAGIGIWEWQK